MLLSLLLTTSLLLSFPQQVISQSPPNEGEEIVIYPEQNTSEIEPGRSQSFIPIKAYCFQDVPFVEIFFLRDIGNVFVELINITTGQISIEWINSSYGRAHIPVSMGNGDYHIEFHVESNSVYIGNFLIQ